MMTNPKKAFHKALYFIFCLYGFVAYADPPKAPEPPDDYAPIDSNLIVLVVAAVLFGTYTIYKHKLNKKRPI